MSVSLLKDSDIHKFIEADPTNLVRETLMEQDVRSKAEAMIRVMGNQLSAHNLTPLGKYKLECRALILGVAPPSAFTDSELRNTPVITWAYDGVFPEDQDGIIVLLIELHAFIQGVTMGAILTDDTIGFEAIGMLLEALGRMLAHLMEDGTIDLTTSLALIAKFTVMFK